ncbi:tyrosine-type recombinase/integrase [Butyrivibrio sp. FC2001]|uniref:tyrosine-type recombinase/integrase n=1 Tax=Butyrivibrio sp. FC2001 TaxID=1280671 RepID=UPI00040ED32B|nr:site-specific integrase [Butyrivibrio sp. FC2001]
MSNKEQTAKGVYQLDNGYWAYRFIIKVNGKNKAQKRVKDELGNPFKTQKQALRARKAAIEKEKLNSLLPQQQPTKKTFAEVYDEYCTNGRSGKAYSTIKKQDSLWKNHLQKKFGDKYIEEITVAEIQDYFEELYYKEKRAYSYVESFLKMFYLVFGQAYSRNYMNIDYYNKLCVNKDTKIHMPKLKIDDDLDIVYFTKEEITQLEKYFRGKNAETAYMLGRYCGLRISECFGLKWNNINIAESYIQIDRQMQYQDGLIKLVSLKTRNAKRKVYMCDILRNYFIDLKRQQATYVNIFKEQRQQNQTIIKDLDGSDLSSLELVNTLPNGKLQTVNSMKYHSRCIKEQFSIQFKYHYLRHTYGTYLAALNTPEYLLCNQMGHSSSNVTHKYYVAISDLGISVLKNNLELL